MLSGGSVAWIAMLFSGQRGIRFSFRLDFHECVQDRFRRGGFGFLIGGLPGSWDSDPGFEIECAHEWRISRLVALEAAGFSFAEDILLRGDLYSVLKDLCGGDGVYRGGGL